MPTMSAKKIGWYKQEGVMLDRLYAKRMKEWNKLHDAYDLKYEQKVRDLDKRDLVKVSRFYPVVRQVLGTIAQNYPKQVFVVDDEINDGVAEILERASSAFMNLTGLKSHVHQAIFDALFTGVGWVRLDYNPAGDELVAPYTTNDDMAEDMAQASRVAPGFVHVDPTGSPHRLGDKRYIREKFWTPMDMLMDDPTIQNKKQIAPSNLDTKSDIGFGEVMGQRTETEEQRSQREAYENGDFVLVERWHMRMDKREVMFAHGVDQPILNRVHPFAKMSFPQVLDSTGQGIFEVDEVTGEPTEPVLDLESGLPAPGFIVEQGFPFVAIKFDLHGDSFYPQPHLRYIEDIQNAILEQVSRVSSLLKRTSRISAISNAEIEDGDNIQEKIRTARDGETIGMNDPNALVPINWGAVPSDPYNFANFLIGMEREISALSPPDAGDAGSATEAAIVAAAAQVNGNWMEAAVSTFYEDIVRNAFQIMGDPRYHPDNFAVNIAPDGEDRVIRALTLSDFLWNYRIQTRVGSTQPLYAELERDRTMAFVAYASGRNNYDQLEIDKLAAEANGVADVDKLMKDDANEPEKRSAQYENDRVVVGQAIAVIPEQDHTAHIEVHSLFREHPTYQQIAQRAQVKDAFGGPVDPQAQQQIQAIEQAMQKHMQEHQQAMQQQQQGETNKPSKSVNTNASSLIGQVRSNAAKTADVVEAETADVNQGVQ